MPCHMCYLTQKTNEDVLHNYEQAIEVIESIAKKNDTIISQRSEDYLLNEIINRIDSIHYSDEWALVNLDLYKKEIINSIPYSGKRYLFENPHKLNELIDENRYKYMISG